MQRWQQYQPSGKQLRQVSTAKLQGAGQQTANIYMKTYATV